MQQTGNGDSSVGGTVQPVWGALASGAPRKATTSSIHTDTSVSAAVVRPRGEVFGFAFANASLPDPTYGYPAWSMNLLTTVAYFGLSIDWNGTIIQSGSGWTTWNSSQLTGLVATAHANNVRGILSINLHDFSPSSTSNMCAALHPRNRATTVAQTVAQVQKMGVDGVNVDYEGTNATCYYGAVLSDEMTSLVAEIRAALPKAYIAVDTYSGSAGYPGGFFNVPAIGPYADSFFVMAYDMEYSNYQYEPLHCSSFCIGPTAPTSAYFYNDTTSMSQYTAVVAASKVILGVPYYGRKECVAGVTPSTAKPNAAPYGSVAAAGYLDASTETGYYANSNYQIHREVFDVTGFSRWDTWTSSIAKCTREMYWDDPASLGRKYDVVNRMGLRGVGIFALQYGGGAPELWSMLQTKFVGCTGATLTAAPGSPQPPGAIIQLVATSTGCTNPVYAYWVQYPNGKWVLRRGFGGGAWNWDTRGLGVGTYTVHVWANQYGNPPSGGEAIGEVVYKIAVLPNCATASVSPAAPSQAAGTSIAFTASSTGCGTPIYQYWVQFLDHRWYMMRTFLGDRTWTWNTSGLPTGTYTVHVWANQYGHSMASPEVIGSSTVTLTGCTSAPVSPLNPSQPAGSTIPFTTAASGCASPQYEYWLQYLNGAWYLKQAFSSNAAWTFNTSGLPPGTYNLHVWANQLGAYMGRPQVTGPSTVTLTGCTTASLSPVNPILQGGTTINFSATSGGCTTPQYEYWVQYPNGRWYMTRAFSADPTWTWTTTGLAVGTYTVHVWANHQGAYTGSWEGVGSSTVRLAPPCSSASINPSSGSTALGGTVTFTASATACPSPAYEFWLQYPGGTWYMMRTWSSDPTWQWNTTGFPKGVYHIHVWANEPGSNLNTFEGLGAATRTVT